MIKQLLEIFDAKQRKMCVVIFFFMLIGSFMELLGVTAIMPYLEAVMAADELMKKPSIQILSSITGITSSNGMLICLGCLIILVYFLKNGYLLLSLHVQNKFCFGIQKALSTRMLRYYMSRPYTFFLNVNSASILRGINEDVSGVYYCLQFFFKLAVEILTVVLIGGYIVLTDYMMAIGVISLAVFCLVCVTLGFKKRLSYMAVEKRKADVFRNKYAYQAITGIKEIAVMQRKDAFIKNYDDASEEKYRAEVAYGFAAGCPVRVIEAICVSGMMLVVTARIISGVDSVAFIPKLGAFAIAAFKLLPSISNMSTCIAGLMFHRPSLQATYDNCIESRQYTEELQKNSIEKKVEDINLSQFRRIEVNNISYKYPMAKDNVLQNLSLSIRKGESIAFIGESGAGKTTLADIILGLLKPQKGQVLCDGKNIFDMPIAWSKTIGYVPQSVFLIDDTIRNNISFGVLEKDIDEDKIWEALEQAQLRKFVETLPKGLNTIVGERGVKLSGGQCQRIAIARALYYNPQILVLDEATSALDTETEDALMESIDALQGRKTLVIVAHRLTTIRNCDTIYEIKDGKAINRNKEEVLQGR